MNLNCNIALSEPSEFPFPFPAYDIQLQFMKKLYFALEHKKLGIFESPTGTGKSLSIICGSIKWLKDHNEHKRNVLANRISILELEKEQLTAEEKDWFAAQSKAIALTQKLNELKDEENKIIEYHKKLEKISSKTKKHTKFKNIKSINKDTINSKALKNNTIQDEHIEDDDVLLEEMNQYQTNEESDEEEEGIFNYRPIQIIIASRTHSQLSQFIGEIRKSPFGEKVRVVSLASRQNYCVNPNVKKLNNMALINEKCLDMQKKINKLQLDENGRPLKKQKSSNNQCPYYKQGTIDDLKDLALNEVLDIEDLVHIGNDLTACPYYASRKAAEDAEVILVPYNTLLHKSTREANGISLKNNIVIIDEAHNLLESLAQIHGSDLTFPQLYFAVQQLKCYKERYNTMFSASTLRYLNQLIFVVNKLLVLLDKEVKEEATDIFTLQNFVLSSQIEQYNFFNLIKFCRGSKIAQKVRSYTLKYPIEEEMVKKTTSKKGVKDFLASLQNKKEPINAKPEEKLKIPVPNNPLLAVASFLECLTYSYHDGRILIINHPEKQHSKFRFLLLNPSSNFSEIIKEARAVIVAGGTMKPYAEFRDRLFVSAGAAVERIVEFSCNHIIPPENILPIAVTKGSNQEKLLFNFSNRMSLSSSLKDILKKTCDSVKGGIVVFYPSYSYESWVYEQIKDINFGRPLFREPQNSGSVEEVLNKYSSAIKKSERGALMFSVVGGKLSEGLNFSDDLGRCIIVVGLPYANIMAADLKEKMTFLDKKEGQGAGQKFYENLCMKSVNQCIGRAVRHRNDYATVLLLDERYAKSSIKNALPDWIRIALKVCDFKETFETVNKFFEDKKKCKPDSL